MFLYTVYKNGVASSLSQPLYVIPLSTLMKGTLTDGIGCVLDFYVVADAVLQIDVYLFFLNITLYSGSLCALINVLQSFTLWFPYYWAL